MEAAHRCHAPWRPAEDQVFGFLSVAAASAQRVPTYSLRIHQSAAKSPSPWRRFGRRGKGPGHHDCTCGYSPSRFRPNRPRCIRAVDAVRAGRDRARARPRGSWDGRPAPRWQPRIFSKHGGSWSPRRIDFLLGNTRDALPAVLFAGDGDRVADRFARTADGIQTAIPEADDDFAWSKLATEADDLAPACIALVAATPIPKNLGCRRTRQAGRQDDAKK